MNKFDNEIKVLYLSYDGLSDHIGQSQILPYILSCRREGIRFHLLTFEKNANAEKIKKLQSLLDSHNITWSRLSFTEGRNILYKVYDFGRFVSKAITLTFKNKFSIIHSRSYFASIIALFVQYFSGAKLIFDKRDFWIDAQVETKRLIPTKFSHKTVLGVLRFFENKLFLHSEHIISLTETAKAIVLKKYPSRKSEDITVIPCCVDMQLFDPAIIKEDEINEKKRLLGLTDSFVLGYVGSVGPTYMIPELLECFRVIKKTMNSVKLLFLVNNDKEEVYKLVENKGLTREDVVVTSATRESMPLYISLFDAGIYFITPTFAKKATSPTKLSEILAMNKPVITNKGVGDVEIIFKELTCGYLINDFNEAGYIKAVEWLKDPGKVCLQADMGTYSLDYGAKKYLSVYRRLAL